ncbi:hypothetical protein FSP39_020945 [Pinctada imbricata]|uniref:Uncharacterized protein n=1 Tax=Pinctada imbricata TaxID=66713 RepID=A0AA88XJR1_PINIB|nr:hypothetical protein FSP39_020945 [Pinctada imbricata]
MARIETEDDMEVPVSEEVVSHAEMRAMLWGRQRENTNTSNEELSPGTCDDDINVKALGNVDGNGTKRKLPRPTSLSDEWKELTRIKESESRESIPQLRMHSKKSIWKNFISLCAGLMLAFTSFLPLRNIQTSLLYTDHLGYISLATVYFSFMIGCIVAPWIVQNAKPKGLLLLAMSSHVFYVAGKFTPIILHFTSGICSVWVSTSTTMVRPRASDRKLRN